MDGIGKIGGARYLVQPADISTVPVRVSAKDRGSLIPILASHDTKMDVPRGTARDYQVAGCHFVGENVELACLAIGAWAAPAVVVSVGERPEVAVEIWSSGSSNFYLAD